MILGLISKKNPKRNWMLAKMLFGLAFVSTALTGRPLRPRQPAKLVAKSKIYVLPRSEYMQKGF